MLCQLGGGVEITPADELLDDVLRLCRSCGVMARILSGRIGAASTLRSWVCSGGSLHSKIPLNASFRGLFMNTPREDVKPRQSADTLRTSW